MKKYAVIFVLTLLASVLVNASPLHSSAVMEGKEIVEARMDCSKLNEAQLLSIGEYLMETMHPGELHDEMSHAMGLEHGTKQHDNFHIMMAKTMYCGMEGSAMMPMMRMMSMMQGSSGMMQTGGGNMMGGKGMMGGGMMNMMGSGGMMDGGMMSGSYGSWLWNYVLVIAIPTLAIIFILWFWKKLNRK